MIPLYTEEEFKTTKDRSLLPLKCEHCGKTFHKMKNRIKVALSGKDEFKAQFCSNYCNGQNKITVQILSCEQCGKSFQRNQAEINKSKHHFCSQSCAAKYSNSHKQTGTRRSKLEVWLESQLTSLYPKYEFHFNRTNTINAELDIYIPELKLAFELNGIFHYEPIYGQNKLDKMQTNDHRKMLACAERGIELCVIDNSKFTHFKPQGAKKYLNIIVKIINEASIRDCSILTLFS